MVILKKLQEPNITLRINYLNCYVAFPNGAEAELKHELMISGIELSASEWIHPDARKSIPFPFGKEWDGKSKLTSMVEAKKFGALYVESNPHINYFGKTLTGCNLHASKNTEDTVVQYDRMVGSLKREQIPIASFPVADLEKFEAHLHVANLIAHMLKFRQAFYSKFPPYKYVVDADPNNPKKAHPVHPVNLNKQTNGTFLHDNSLQMIKDFTQKKHGFNFYLGPATWHW